MPPRETCEVVREVVREPAGRRLRGRKLRGHGRMWVIDAYRCAPALLRSIPRIRGLLSRIVKGMDLHPVGPPRLFRFPGRGGITAIWMLKESHLACHTFPEFGSACLDLFTCHPVRPWPFKEGICRALSAREVRIRSLRRRYRAVESRAP